MRKIALLFVVGVVCFGFTNTPAMAGDVDILSVSGSHCFDHLIIEASPRIIDDLLK